MSRWAAYGVAIFDAVLCEGIVWIIYLASKRDSPAPWLVLAALVSALTVPVFYALVLFSRGFAGALAVGAVAGAVGSVALMLLAGERQTSLQWAGFGLIIVGALMRELGGK